MKSHPPIPERGDGQTRRAIEGARQLLGQLHEEFYRTRGDLVETPARMVRALRELTSGYEVEKPEELLSKTFDADGYDEVVVLRDVEFSSLCEHHVLPFTGTMSLAYLPGDRVVGLSKLARVVEVYARRFQIQERLTKQVADAVSKALSPRGVAVVCRATHSCVSLRGVRKSKALMLTSVMRGVFMDKPQARAEVMRLLDFD